MTKQGKFLRISSQTARELAELVQATGDTQAGIISRAIAELHGKLIGKRAPKSHVIQTQSDL